MGRLTLAIDPATHLKRCGWAVFQDAVLFACGTADKVSLKGVSVDTLITEVPQVYTRKTSKGDPNDLIQVAIMVGRFQAWVNHSVLVEPLPHAWKRAVPKDVYTRRILGRLTLTEIVLVPKNHNVIDAVGLGLWHLGRL